MIPGLYQTALKSIRYSWHKFLYQIVITAILCAVITGSFLTGSSVKKSLRDNSLQHLGNTGILISSGMRYFSRDLERKMSLVKKFNCAGLLEMRGSVTGFSNQKTLNNINIYAAGDDFYSFQNSKVIPVPGEVIINNHLSGQLGVKAGDDLILRFRKITGIPADAPFAESNQEESSLVLKISSVLDPGAGGDFSLSISQLTPMNVFISMTDLKKLYGKEPGFNRLILDRHSGLNTNEISELLKEVIEPADLGLTIRKVRATGQTELVSDRIFIDNEIVSQVRKNMPEASPVITYMANEIRSGKNTTPYSFVSAIPASVYSSPDNYKGVKINKWLAEDLKVQNGDSITLTWYSPDSLKSFATAMKTFVIGETVPMNGIWSDSTLMPDFPGISTSEHCSSWNAGVPVKLDQIRDKDEAYWDEFRGTPKVFISYDEGKKLWGNNFGVATSLRFPDGISVAEVNKSLSGKFEPGLSGFTVTDIREDSLSAASKSVDFGTLFISLGFFLIVASFLLLWFAVSFYLETKKNEIKTLFALGFRRKAIGKLIFLETSLSAVIGCIIGAFSGLLVNILIIKALNSVWQGAVQTNTLTASFSMAGMLPGFILTMFFIEILLLFRIRRQLRSPYKEPADEVNNPKVNYAGISSIAFFIATIAVLIASQVFNGKEIVLSFISGVLLMISILLFLRWRLVSKGMEKLPYDHRRLSGLYYSSFPSHAITPVLFIAAGIFAFFITVVNRKDFDSLQNKRSSGTGGYLYWIENSLPIGEDPRTMNVKAKLGLDDDLLQNLQYVTMKRLPGNDASCLNLNHITAPPILGIDPSDFIKKKAFSFAGRYVDKSEGNAWKYLDKNAGNDIVYGIADQTVLEWGLKLKVGDTLALRSESGRTLKIVIAAGLKSSVFQGYIIIGKENFRKFFPSVPGISVLLVDGDQGTADSCRTILGERLGPYGPDISRTTDRLSSFYKVTNTYLTVFGVFGGFGMIIGIAGLGFVILRNYNRRRKEFALMLVNGFGMKSIRRMMFSEQMRSLFTGIITGITSAILATLPSLKNSADIPWVYICLMIAAIAASGSIAITVASRSISRNSLVLALKNE
jgi:ABC-type antimicrobial peptide transport system permease subunit